jgi:peptide methionine sulfoxide reductase MsrB
MRSVSLTNQDPRQAIEITAAGNFRELKDGPSPGSLVKERNPRPSICVIIKYGLIFGAVAGLFYWFLLAQGVLDPGPNCQGDVQTKLKFGCATDLALSNRICCHNSRGAEPAGYFQSKSLFSQLNKSGVTIFYDSVCGVPLFKAPVGRSFADWQKESNHHGWPSFRDEETFQENIRIHGGGEVVSSCGVHLGHNIPDGRNRYCIDLVCIAGAEGGVGTNSTA